MSRDSFLLCYVLGSAALAFWVAQRLPRLAPRSFRAAAVHLAAALVVGAFLAPILRLVPGQPALPSVMTALFAVGLPALTYMLLTGMWLLMLVAGGNPLARGR
jgi:hypothetical protein